MTETWNKSIDVRNAFIWIRDRIALSLVLFCTGGFLIRIANKLGDGIHGADVETLIFAILVGFAMPTAIRLLVKTVK